jgi:hypothetical protein
VSRLARRAMYVGPSSRLENLERDEAERPAAFHA